MQLSPSESARAKAEPSKGPGLGSPRRLAAYLRRWPALIAIVVVIAVVGAGYAYWHYSKLHPSTDDAYVQANVVQIAPIVSGVVSEVPIKSFAAVKSGDVLIRIDQARYEAALKAAEDRLRAAQQQPAKATTVEGAQAAVEKARLELENAALKSPVDGILGNVTLRPGTFARAGMPPFPIVDTSSWWVDANFKETDLDRIHPGQKATVSVDIYPGHEFTGEVDAVSPLSTSALSLLPAQNATGNWIKLTQRFPVRISLSLRPDDPPLRLGASTTVTIDTSNEGSRNGSR